MGVDRTGTSNGLRTPTRSPRAWGWTHRGRGRSGPTLQVPTRVGVDRATGSPSRMAAPGPHARGGGPTRQPTHPRPSTRSPRAWGWTVGRGITAATPVQVPTRVGVDRDRTSAPSSSSPGPHARGGGPAPRERAPRAVYRSPRAWGWTGAPEVGRGDRRQVPTRGGGPVWPKSGWAALCQVPTRVGVDRRRSWRAPRCRPGPHARGGGPKVKQRQQQNDHRSPRAWGWTATSDA